MDTEELTSPAPIGIGTTVRTRMRSMGREYEYTWEVVAHQREVVAHQPPNRMTIESTSGLPYHLVYELSPQKGGTLVDFSVTGRPTGVLRLLER